LVMNSVKKHVTHNAKQFIGEECFSGKALTNKIATCEPARKYVVNWAGLPTKGRGTEFGQVEELISVLDTIQYVLSVPT